MFSRLCASTHLLSDFPGNSWRICSSLKCNISHFSLLGCWSEVLQMHSSENSIGVTLKLFRLLTPEIHCPEALWFFHQDLTSTSSMRFKAISFYIVLLNPLYVQKMLLLLNFWFLVLLERPYILSGFLEWNLCINPHTSCLESIESPLAFSHYPVLLWNIISPLGNFLFEGQNLPLIIIPSSCFHNRHNFLELLFIH